MLQSFYLHEMIILIINLFWNFVFLVKKLTTFLIIKTPRAMNSLDMNNKENSKNHHNTSGLFSNPLINEKLSPKLNTEESYDSIVGEQCSKHKKAIGNLFCAECLSYKLCSSCIPDSHVGHEVMHFPSKDDLISGTRETILESLE